MSIHAGPEGTHLYWLLSRLWASNEKPRPISCCWPGLSQFGWKVYGGEPPIQGKMPGSSQTKTPARCCARLTGAFPSERASCGCPSPRTIQTECSVGVNEPAAHLAIPSAVPAFWLPHIAHDCALSCEGVVSTRLGNLDREARVCELRGPGTMLPSLQPLDRYDPSDLFWSGSRAAEHDIRGATKVHLSRKRFGCARASFMRALLRHAKNARIEAVLREFIADAEAWEISARRQSRLPSSF